MRFGLSSLIYETNIFLRQEYSKLNLKFGLSPNFNDEVDKRLYDTLVSVLKGFELLYDVVRDSVAYPE